MLKSTIKTLINKLTNKITQAIIESNDQLKISNGEVLARLNSLQSDKVLPFNSYEFKIFSQWGDDGLINFLTNNIKLNNKFFVEFGVENYTECNTRFLVEAFNWEGLIIDGSTKNMNQLKSRGIYWKHSITADDKFITKENIEQIFSDNNVPKDLALLHIDIDGNDYWVWDAIKNYSPSIVIVEYNSTFGPSSNISIPYKADFNRTSAHYSNLYFGASLGALNHLATKKDYALVGCNEAGNNAYFVKRDLLNDKVTELSVQEAYKESKFRESRDKNGNLTYLKINQRLKELKGLKVVDVENMSEITFK